MMLKKYKFNYLSNNNNNTRIHDLLLMMKSIALFIIWLLGDDPDKMGMLLSNEQTTHLNARLEGISYGKSKSIRLKRFTYP